MNKKEYRSAIAKLKAREEFKEKAAASMIASNTKVNRFKLKRMAPVFSVLLIVACISTAFILYLQRDARKTTNSDISNNASSEIASGDFKITSQGSDASACYAAIVYLDGYEYSPSSWLSYSRQGSTKAAYESLKGEKLGTVTLDLKGKTYKGTPPSFSSTYDVGTEIYAVKNMKKERAILVVNKEYAEIFYRDRKAVMDLKTPINLTLAEVFNMMTDSPKVSSVELRSEEDGSWIGATDNNKLLELINKELPKLSILQSSEFGKNPYDQGKRIPINLVFSDGAALHMQVIPEAKSASVFGGFVPISKEFCSAVLELPKLVKHYPTVSNLLPYAENQVSYLHLINHTNGDEVLCKNPEWSRSPLFSIFNYYPMTETKSEETDKLVMTATLGKSKDSSVTIYFYENSSKNIIVKLNDKYYKPVKGQMNFEELDSFLYNFTDLGIK